MQRHVFNQKLLCTTPLHILICTNTSSIEESSVCVHICLFSYQHQFCAILSGNKTKMLCIYTNRGPKLNAECFNNILMNKNMKLQLISWEESSVCVNISLVTGTIYNSSFVLYLLLAMKTKTCWSYTIPNSKLNSRDFHKILMNI